MKFRNDRTHIAVVGVAYRMPLVAGDGFWEALLDCKDLITSVAPARWAQDSYLHPRKGEPGTSYTFAAGSVGDISGFDAAFFGISPREAEQMDPQQRLLLEMSWEAFENGGIRPSSFRGQRCGVYVGLSSVDYAYRRADDLGSIDATTMTGNTGSIAANRISYVFDLRGPSMTVDTACSSSLVALHQASQSIRHGESDAALVGGISLHLHPYAFVGFSKASMLSPHGRCSVFDEQGDGYVRSEGGAVVLLKPLTQAIADGNRILAVIAETGVNNDGRKGGLTVPSHTAQAALLREVYERAGIAPAEIDYFEAHGTGTAVGDPIEARAIGESIGRHRAAEHPLLIGSVKSQVGHLEAASGMAGLLKVLHVLRHRRVPPNIHLNRLNPNIDFAGWNLAPVTTPMTLKPTGRLVAGVSAFGFGGTNAHAVLTTFEARVARPRPPVTSRPPLMLSARSPAALKEGARRMARFLRERVDLSDYDIAYSAMFARDIHTHRLSVEREDRAGLAQALERFVESGSAPGVVTGRHRGDASAPAFVFSGNGSQWVGMGLELLKEEPVFRATLEEVDHLFAAYAQRSIIADLRAVAVSGGLDRTEVAQPALFAVQAGVTRLFESRGIYPAAVCGHSVGEMAAAWACGALTLEAAVRVIYERSTHQGPTRGAGCMAAVELAEADIRSLLAALDLREQIAVAAINSPVGVTVAGDHGAMSRLAAAMAAREISFKRLALDYAFHSAAMDPIRAGLVRSLSQLPCAASRIPFYSTVTGNLLEGTELDADYWWRNVREPVRFEAAIRAMVGSGINTFVEIGPRPVLVSYINAIGKAEGASCFAVPSLMVKDCGRERIRSVAQELELSGALHDPARRFAVVGQVVDLPGYAWQRERYWHPSTSDSLGLLARQVVHPLLGYALAADSHHWENHLDTSKLPLYADHAVGGSVVFPAAGFVEMALAAAGSRRPGASLAIENLEILAPLLLDAEHSKVVRLRINADDCSFTIVSRDRGGDVNWRTHVVGRIVDDFVPAPVEPLIHPSGAPDVTADVHYALARAHGLQYGPAFQSVTSVWFRGGELVGTLRLPDVVSQQPQASFLHPALLDGAFQLLLDLACRESGGHPPPASGLLSYLPVRIDRLELARTPACVAAAKVVPGSSRHRSRRALHADFTLYDESGTAVGLVRGVRFRAANLQGGAQQAPSWITTRAVAVPRRELNRASGVPSTVEAARLCAQHLHSPRRAASRERFAREVEPLLDVLCASFAERALREVAPDKTIDIGTLLLSGSVCEEGVPLLQQLLELLAEDAVVAFAEGQWRWSTAATDLHFPEPPDIWNSLIGDHPEYGGLIARTGAAGMRLADRLRGGPRCEPRERGEVEISSSWIDTCTQSEAAAVFESINEVLAAAVVNQPPAARLRALYVLGTTSREEIGGAAVPPAFDRDRCDIVVAAPTREALDELRLRHAAVAQVPGHVVDLDVPGSPGVEALGGRFDLIVMSDGLAVAEDPAQRLTNVRKLLFSGGLLLVIEQYSSRADELAYGLNALWWRAERSDTGPHFRPRRWSPQAWHSALHQAGFEETQHVQDAPGCTTGPYLLIARAEVAQEDDSAAHPDPVAPRTWLVLQDPVGYSSQLATILASRLVERGQRLVTVTAGQQYRVRGRDQFELDATSCDHWRELLTELQRQGVNLDGWVHLAGLNVGATGAPSAARIDVQEERASVLLSWLQACLANSVRPECWVVAAQAGLSLLPEQARSGERAPEGVQPDRLRDAALWGLTRVAMQEFPELCLRWIDLADPLPADENGARLAREILQPDAEDEVILTSEGRFAPRMTAQGVLPGEIAMSSSSATARRQRVRLDFPTPGPFRNLTWTCEDGQTWTETDTLGEGELEIEVRATGLNFRDVMYAMGLLPDEAVEDGFCGPTLGMELSGVVARTGPGVELAPGDEVIAIAPASFANRVRTKAFAVARKPPAWSFAAAATVPTAFFTAYYSLVELARLQPGERVLIHGAAGGVGIAAIQIARHLGAEVLATAGTPEKRDIVRLLGADQVVDSRSVSFDDEILRATGNAGVDVVLNSLAGESMRRNLRLLRPFGRMIELGKRDFYENSRLGLRPFRNNISYFGLDADQLIAHRPQTASRIFRELMKLFADGALRPLPLREFCAADVESAFRHMQASRHIGKVVVTFPEGFDRGAESSRAPDFPAAGLRPDATYLVTGGLSGFGLSTAWWLVSRGARHLALMSRSGAATPEIRRVLDQFAAAAVSVTPIACDVSDSDALRSALNLLDANMPPLRGVVHAAMVIEDALIRDMNRGQLHRTLAPKIGGALNLHDLTRDRALDFFLVYSSATTLFGNPGQAAYVAANMALEALAQERRALGLPVTCVGWGPIGDAGYLARNEKIRGALTGRLGGRALSSEEALRSLDQVLAGAAPQVGLLDFDWRVLRRFLPGAQAPKFSRLERGDTSGLAPHESTRDLRQRLMELPEGELLPAMVDIVRGEIAKILRATPERIEAGASLLELGMDSLMAVELASSIESHLGVQLSALALSEAPTIERIAARIARNLRSSDEGPNAESGVDSGLLEQVQLVAARHASEVTVVDAEALRAEVLNSTSPISLTAGHAT